MPQPIRIAVIMAGGSGERFWPLSRRIRPKQLLRLASADETLIEESIHRIAPLIPPARILIATSLGLVEPIRQARTGVPDENVIGEPCKRNTAGCLAYAAAQALARFGGEANESSISMAVLTADHRIDSPERFRATVEAALTAAENQGALATIGAVPDRPETGFGYVEIAEGAESVLSGGGADWPPVYPVARFREKPDLAAAEEFIATGRFFWNCGMFFWRLDRFLEELSHTASAHALATRQMAAALRAGDSARVERIFEGLEDISIDYALMEKARGVVMARANFAWDDVGALDALDRGYPRDGQGNVAVGDPILIDTHDCIVYNEPGAERVAVAAIGVEGLAIVVTPDGVLVVPKDRAQEVKKAVTELKKRGAGQL